MRRFFLTAMLLLPAQAALAQTTIELATSARIAQGAPVRLADVATISGHDAGALADIVVLADPAGASSRTARAGWVEVDLDDIRAALHGRAVNWGRTTLNGSTCAVRFAPPAGPPAADRPRGAPSRREPDAQVVDLSGLPTIRTYIAASLARLYDVPNTDLRLAFDPKDQDTLDTPAAGRRIDIQPGAATSSSVVPLRVFLFSGDRLLSSASLSVSALVRRTVVTGSCAIERSRPILAEQLMLSTQWVSPGTPPSCTIAQAVGATARSRISAGRVITRDLIEPPIVVKRGDIVDVNCLSGYVRVTLKARALKDGRDGEQVPFCLEGSKKPFTARMSGTRAVVQVDPQTDSAPRSPPAPAPPPEARR